MGALWRILEVVGARHHFGPLLGEFGENGVEYPGGGGGEEEGGFGGAMVVVVAALGFGFPSVVYPLSRPVCKPPGKNPNEGCPQRVTTRLP